MEINPDPGWFWKLISKGFETVSWLKNTLLWCWFDPRSGILPCFRYGQFWSGVNKISRIRNTGYFNVQHSCSIYVDPERPDPTCSVHIRIRVLTWFRKLSQIQLACKNGSSTQVLSKSDVLIFPVFAEIQLRKFIISCNCLFLSRLGLLKY